MAMSWLDFADLSDHGSVIVLQALKVLVGQQPSFSGMGHGSVQARDVHTDTGLVSPLCKQEMYT